MPNQPQKEPAIERITLLAPAQVGTPSITRSEVLDRLKALGIKRITQ